VLLDCELRGREAFAVLKRVTEGRRIRSQLPWCNFSKEHSSSRELPMVAFQYGRLSLKKCFPVVWLFAITFSLALHFFIFAITRPCSLAQPHTSLGQVLKDSVLHADLIKVHPARCILTLPITPIIT
jgi:hypothetical protein